MVVNIMVWLSCTSPLLCCSRYQYSIFRQLFSSGPDSEICSINMTVEASAFWEALSYVVLCSLIKQLDLGLALIWVIVQFPENIFWKCQEDVLHVFGDIKYWITRLCHLSLPSLSLHTQHGLIYVSAATVRSLALREITRDAYWQKLNTHTCTHHHTHMHTLAHPVRRGIGGSLLLQTELEPQRQEEEFSLRIINFLAMQLKTHPFNLLQLEFPYLWNGDKKNTCPPELFLGSIRLATVAAVKLPIW